MRKEEIAGTGEMNLPRDRILLTEEKTTGVSEEKETKKGKTGGLGDTETIEMNEESTRTVTMKIFRRTGGKEKYFRIFISERTSKKQRRAKPLSRG